MGQVQKDSGKTVLGNVPFCMEPLHTASCGLVSWGHYGETALFPRPKGKVWQEGAGHARPLPAWWCRCFGGHANKAALSLQLQLVASPQSLSPRPRCHRGLGTDASLTPSAFSGQSHLAGPLYPEPGSRPAAHSPPPQPRGLGDSPWTPRVPCERLPLVSLLGKFSGWLGGSWPADTSFTTCCWLVFLFQGRRGCGCKINLWLFFFLLPQRNHCVVMQGGPNPMTFLWGCLE